MTRFSDAALLKGDFAKMMKEMPKKPEWDKASCENKAEEAAQEVAKHIFAMQQGLDPKKEQLEIITYSSKGPIRVIGLMPGEGDLVRIDGIFPETGDPISIVQHTNQLSLTFSKAPVAIETTDDEDKGGMQIGFVIFDELSRRKKQRSAAKRKKKTARK